jgi:hypothetical protein
MASAIPAVSLLLPKYPPTAVSSRAPARDDAINSAASQQTR